MVHLLCTGLHESPSLSSWSQGLCCKTIMTAKGRAMNFWSTRRPMSLPPKKKRWRVTWGFAPRESKWLKAFGLPVLTFGRPPVRVRSILRSYFYCSGLFLFCAHTWTWLRFHFILCIYTYICLIVFWSASFVQRGCKSQIMVSHELSCFQTFGRWPCWWNVVVSNICGYQETWGTFQHIPGDSTLSTFFWFAAYVTKWWLIRDQVLSYLWIMFANFCGLRFPFLLPKIANGNNLQGDCSITTNWLIGWRWINGFHYPPLWSRACPWVFWLGCIHLQDPPMQQCNNTLVEEVRWMSGEGILWIYIIGALMIVDDRPGEKPSNKVV